MTSKPEETQESNTNTTHPSSSTSWLHGRAYEEKDERLKFWGILVFSVIGATATTYAVGHLRHTIDWIYTQFSRSHSSWKDATNSSFRTNFKEEARRRYNRRMQEEYEEEMERVERIRRMQSVFNRERTKYKKTYESWREYGPGAYHQHFQREDWYWKTDASYKDQRTNSRTTPTNSGNYMLSHHYSVLGLDRWRTKPYTEDEIKIAFRAKAMEFHPDQNQDNKEAAEAKFKEVMTSYEAIKSERKNGKS